MDKFASSCEETRLPVAFFTWHARPAKTQPEVLLRGKLESTALIWRKTKTIHSQKKILSLILSKTNAPFHKLTTYTYKLIQ